MSIFERTLAQLRRPRLLVQAARHGLSSYDRDSVVSRIVKGAAPGPGTASFDLLARAERALDDARRRGDVGYSAAGHVEALTALIAEARLLLGVGRLS